MSNSKLNIIKISLEEYGDLHREHCLEIYKVYVDLAEKLSGRRQSANSFFLSINTAMIGLLGYFQSNFDADSQPVYLYLPISLAGIIICYAWYRLIRSYKQLSSGKFKVINYLEQILPCAPYELEWELLGKGKDPSKYLPFTNVERYIPLLFVGFHILLLINNLWIFHAAYK